jgi:hypothetical protein
MEQPRAGIELQGSVLRYAELERQEAKYHLLRLGSCDFDFDVVAELQSPTPRYLDIMAEALCDVLSGTRASKIEVALHPLQALTFGSPQPDPIESAVLYERLTEESVWLSGQEAGAFRLYVEPGWVQTLPEGERVRWYQVLALPKHVEQNLAQVLRRAPCSAFRIRLSTAGVAETLSRMPGFEGELPPEVSLAIGCYETHTEYTLCRRGSWMLSHSIQGTAANVPYFSVALLHKLGLAAAMVEQLLLYGTHVTDTLLETLRPLFPVEPVRLNPLVLTTLDPHSLTNSFEVEAYAPCIGVALS